MRGPLPHRCHQPARRPLHDRRRALHQVLRLRQILPRGRPHVRHALHGHAARALQRPPHTGIVPLTRGSPQSATTKKACRGAHFRPRHAFFVLPPKPTGISCNVPPDYTPPVRPTRPQRRIKKGYIFQNVRTTISTRTEIGGKKRAIRHSTFRRVLEYFAESTPRLSARHSSFSHNRRQRKRHGMPLRD